jgi:phosphoserine phosphatase
VPGTGAPLRSCLVPSRPLLVVLDADSTLIRNEVIELIADEAGRGIEVTAATEAAMRGEVDFAASLRSRVAALEGVPRRRSPT